MKFMSIYRPNTTQLSEDQKIYSLEELKNLGLSEYKVRVLVSEGSLKKLTRSYYENTYYSGEESDFFYVRAYAPKGIVCLLSAAVYYNLTTYIPDAVDIAIPRKARLSSVPSWPRFNIHYYTDERYQLGSTIVEDGKNSFRIYDIEKTVVDIVFYREKIGISETKEILVTYLARKDRKLNRLLEYSRTLKCEKTMRTYLEVLI